jgi:EAL domain-containing protein (putative c-di-GMP-specific phosphodiesterase class I)
MGRNRWEVYDHALEEEGEHARDVTGRLRTALLTGGLGVHYQVVVDHAGRVHGVEALARVSDGAGGYLSAQEVVAVAERDGLIAPLGARVLDLAVAQASHWVRTGSPARISVNVSTRQVARHDLSELVLAALERYGLAPAMLELEVTETSLLQSGVKGLGQLLALREAGVGVAIDDYGTGHSSLAYLHDLPATTVKVDRSFVAGLPRDRRSAAIVRGVAQMAGDLGMTCIAEGVEEQGQVEWLEQHAPNALLQGYLLGAPLPADELLLRTRRGKVPNPRMAAEAVSRA